MRSLSFLETLRQFSYRLLLPLQVNPYITSSTAWAAARQPTPQPVADRPPPLGGVSSFAFQGTNAHATLSNPVATSLPAARDQKEILWHRQHISVLAPMHPLLHAAAVITPTQRGLQATHLQRVMFELPMNGSSLAPFNDHTVQGQGIFPGAGHLEVSAAALTALTASGHDAQGAGALTAAVFHAPFLLGTGPLRLSLEVATGRTAVADVRGTIHMSAWASSCIDHVAMQGSGSSSFSPAEWQSGMLPGLLDWRTRLQKAAAATTVAVGSVQPDGDIFPSMRVSPAALDAALQLAAVPQTIPNPSPAINLPPLMIPAALGCFYLPANSTVAGINAGPAGQNKQSASASRHADAAETGADSRSSKGVVHDHSLGYPDSPTASCQIGALHAKPLHVSKTGTAAEQVAASHLVSQGQLEVIWQVEHPLANPLAAGNPAPSPGVALRQVGSAAVVIGDLIAALQRSLSSNSPMPQQLVTSGSLQVLPGLMGRDGLASLGMHSRALGAVMRCFAHEAPTLQAQGSDTDALSGCRTMRHGAWTPARLIVRSKVTGAPGADRTDGHGMAQRHGASLVPLLVPSNGANSPAPADCAASDPSGTWLITGEQTASLC